MFRRLLQPPLVMEKHMRDHCTEEQLWAHRILDAVKHGLPATDGQIKRALWILGDAGEGA